MPAGPYPFFGGTDESHAFPGVDVGVLLLGERRIYVDGGPRWQLTVRSRVHEDIFGEVMELTE